MADRRASAASDREGPSGRRRPDVELDLQGVFTAGYDRARYDYSREPEPPLSPEDAAWAEDLLGGVR